MSEVRYDTWGNRHDGLSMTSVKPSFVAPPKGMCFSFALFLIRYPSATFCCQVLS